MKKVYNILLLLIIAYTLSCVMVFAAEPEKHLTIKDILQLAVEKNTDIKASKNELLDAKAGLKTVTLENYPSIALQTTVQQFDAYASKEKKADFNIIPMLKINFTMGNNKLAVGILNENYANESFDCIDPFEPTYELNYSYDLLRKTSFLHDNEVDIARLRVQKQETNYLQEQGTIFNDVLETYFSTLKAANKKNQNLQKAELLKQHLALTKTKQKQGNATEIDVLEMENALNNALLDAEKAENEFHEFRSLLCLTVGLEPSQNYIFDEPGNIVMKAVEPEKALFNNVKIKYSELDTRISSKLLENEKKNSSSEFVFTASKKQYDDAYSFGLSLKKMLTNDHSREQTLQRAANEKQLAEERQRLEVERANIEYKSLLNENNILKRKLEINASIVSQLEQKLKLVREQYKLGGVAELKVIETIDSLEAAKISYQDSYYDYQKSNIALLIFINPDLEVLLEAL